jgi:hypothetical protein
MSISSLFAVLSSFLGGAGPEIGKVKYYHDNSIFKESVTTCGDSITCGSSLTLGEKIICGDTYLALNALEKNPKPPNLFVSGDIFGGKNLTITNTSIFGNTVVANRNVIVNGKIILAGCGDVAAEIIQAKALPSSDERLKENIQPLKNSLDKVTQLRGVSFEFKKDKKQQIGVIAQEVEKIIPEVVGENPDGYKGVSYGNIVGLLIEAIKEQQEQINQLSKEISELKGENR